MIKNTAWLPVTFFGVMIVLVGNYMLGFFPTDAHNIPTGVGSPIFAFEVARTPQDLINVFGHIDDPARPARIAAMDAGNLLDFAFMALYALFIASFFIAIYSATKKKIWLGFAALGILSGVADAVENNILLGLTNNLEAAHNLGMLAFPVWFKFFAIMITAIAAGVFLAQQKILLWRTAGIIAALSATTILISFANPYQFGWLLQFSITISWSIMLLFAGVHLLKRKSNQLTNLSSGEPAPH